jgi:hypothetical protein
MMNLDEAQRKTISTWIAEGLRLSDIQTRLGTELGVHLTYMEVRMLVDDLKLTPKDAEPVKPAELARAEPGSSLNPATPTIANPASALSGGTPPPTGGVSVTVDEISRPGTVASGGVRFSDGQSAEWYLDQTGRLGLMPKQQGYRPAQEDVAAFQAELQNELARLGM